MSLGQDFLGIGIDAGFNQSLGKISWVEYEESIRQSIFLILGTSRGERVMRPDFGCDLREATFSVLNTQTISLVQYYITEALKKWEPRINVLKITVAAEGVERNKLAIDISYEVIHTNNRYNLVYPFYLEESR